MAPGMNGASPPAHSPTLGAAAPSHGKTQRQHSANSQLPFSPVSNSSAQGYDWLALDVNNVLNTGASGPGMHGHHGPGGGASTSGGGAHLLGHGIHHPPTPGNSGAFGPEISDGLEWLQSIGAVGNLGWEDGSGGGWGP